MTEKPAAKPVAGAPARTGPKTKEQKRAEAAARAARSAPLRAARSRMTALEKEIAELEKRQGELTADLEAPETYQQPGKAQALNRELSGVVDRLQAATAAWEKDRGRGRAAGETKSLSEVARLVPKPLVWKAPNSGLGTSRSTYDFFDQLWRHAGLGSDDDRRGQDLAGLGHVGLPRSRG